MLRKQHHIFKKYTKGLCIAQLALLCILLFSNPQTIFAQAADTVILTTTPDAIPITPLTVTKKHSPAKATWMSVALPGLGQAYNKQYWKIPIIYVGAGIVAYLVIDNYKGAQKFKQEYIDRDKGDTAAFDPSYLNYTNDNILSLYNSYQKNFELTLIVGGVIYLLNILDAYVFAHLFTFELNDDLSMNIAPTVNYESLVFSSRPQVGFNMKLSIKNNKPNTGRKLLSFENY